MDTKLAKVSHLSQVLSCVFSAIMLAIVVWPLARPPQAQGGYPHLYGETSVIAYWPLALLALCIVGAAGLHFASAMVARKPKTDNRVPTVPPSRQGDTNHEDCERKIRNLQSTVARLQRNDQTQGVQITAGHSRIEQLQGELAGLKWLTEIARRQSESTESYVQVSCLLLEHSLIQEPLLIYFRFRLHSSCVYELSVNALSGAIRMGNRRLGSAVPVNYSPRIERNEAQGFKIGETGFLTVVQPLTREDAVFILNGGSEFFFDNLFIEADTVPAIEWPVKLTTVDSISSKELREKYPKLDIQFRSAVYSSIVVRGGPMGSDLGYLVTVDVTIQNLRKTKIDIDTIQLSVMTIRTRFPQMQAEVGDIHERAFVDESGAQRTLGKQLKNLAGFPLSIIARGKVSGCFQFSLEGVALGALEDATATLILTDRHGEHHVSNHDLVALA